MIQKIPPHITNSCIDGLIQGVLWCVFEQYCISIFTVDSIVADALVIFVLPDVERAGDAADVGHPDAGLCV